MTTRAVHDSFDFDPLRPPDWRWRLAGHLAESRHRLRRQRPAGAADEFTWRAARYRRCWVGSSAQRAARRDPQLHAALTLGQPQSLELEARVLAGQTPAEIGQALRLAPTLAALRAALLFDVADRLDAHDYMHCCVLTWPDPNASAATRLAPVVRRLSYYGGPLVAEAAIRHLDLVRDIVQGRHDLAAVEPAEARRMGYLALAMTAQLTPAQALQLADLSLDWDRRQAQSCEAVFARQTALRLDQVLAAGGWQALAEKATWPSNLKTIQIEQVA